RHTHGLLLADGQGTRGHRFANGGNAHGSSITATRRASQRQHPRSRDSRSQFSRAPLRRRPLALCQGPYFATRVALAGQTMRTQDFHRLTRVAQDRFVDAVHRRTVPKPIISRPRLAPVPWPWLIASGVSFVGFCVAVGWGYGDLHSGVALAPRWLVAVYGALLALSTYTGLQAIARILQARNVPFPYGTYAFPAAVIEARTTLFRVYPLSELTAVEVAGTRNVVLTFQAGTRLEFRAR